MVLKLRNDVSKSLIIYKDLEELMTTNNAMQGIRAFLWPIYGKEHKKFLPMTIMISLILFNYTVLRNVKDSLIVTNAGTETITFLKVWTVVPAAFIYFLIYSKLSNLLNREALYYTVVVPFLVFFALFAFVLYPNRELLHPTTSADWLQSVLPNGLSGIVALYRYWTYSLFYTLAELWGSVVTALAFWQLANDVTKTTEAKRFYAHFYLLANIAVFAAGYASRYFSQLRQTAAEGVDSWGITLNYLTLLVVACGIVVLGLYYYLTHVVLKDPTMLKPKEEKGMRKQKLKMSMGQSVKFLFSSPYLGLIAVLVLCYGICINFAEVSWKHAVHLQYPTENEYNAFMGLLYMAMGAVTFVIILIGSSIVRVLGWKKGALATPVMLGLTGLLFFAFLIFRDQLSVITDVLGVTPLLLAVWFGLIQNVLSKSTKYALFDPTKEMAYIPLDEESKMKGKAAIDVVGSRLGKSGGSLIQQAMFVFIGPISVITPYVGILMVVIILVWIVAVSALSKRFNQLTAEKDAH